MRNKTQEDENERDEQKVSGDESSGTVSISYHTDEWCHEERSDIGEKDQTGVCQTSIEGAVDEEGKNRVKSI